MSDAYDPQEDEGRRPSQYVSRKDLRIISIVLLVLAAIGYPVYMYMLSQVNTSICGRNFHKIGVALQNYLSDFDDHFPYAYETVSGTSEIAVHDNYAYTWQWVLQPYIKDWKVFTCPAALPEEHTRTTDPNSSQFQISDFGMVSAYSGVAVASVSAPNQKIIIGETSRNGARGTYDPMKLTVGDKTISDDGFMIGFDNAQIYPDEATKYATRLAFPDTSKGEFTPDAGSRHPGGIHLLYVDGSLSFAGPTVARVSLPGGPWEVPKPPPVVKRRSRGQ